ncbi:MAG: hypothetical protein A2284_03350 [Deltaproteobacteria bacterium RIFOXYA12_FULL_61_11]|nr:MAG: hypothetical protein A2284_03350 [Deltaproteobacteria bacterium RIFOXYA12_FULL_61_11]
MSREEPVVEGVLQAVASIMHKGRGLATAALGESKMPGAGFEFVRLCFISQRYQQVIITFNTLAM